VAGFACICDAFANEKNSTCRWASWGKMVAKRTVLPRVMTPRLDGTAYRSCTAERPNLLQRACVRAIGGHMLVIPLADEFGVPTRRFAGVTLHGRPPMLPICVPRTRLLRNLADHEKRVGTGSSNCAATLLIKPQSTAIPADLPHLALNFDDDQRDCVRAPNYWPGVNPHHPCLPSRAIKHP